MISNPDKEKLGNGLRLILNEFGPTSKTSILKLLYFIDEKSVEKCGRPVFNLEYQVWQFGPVNPNLYFDLSEGVQLFQGYIAAQTGKDTFAAVGEFSDDEFSDYEIGLIKSVCQSLKDKKAFELVDKAHHTEGLWYQTALENGLLKAFEQKTQNTSSVTLDLSQLVANDPFLKSQFEQYQESLNTF